MTVKSETLFLVKGFLGLLTGFIAMYALYKGDHETAIFLMATAIWVKT